MCHNNRVKDYALASPRFTRALYIGGSVRRIVFFAVLATLSACATLERKDDDLGYEGYSKEGETVFQTLERLRSDPNIVIRKDEGWTIVSSSSGRQIWSFTSVNHPAHPSYVKREVVEKDGAVYIETSARCGAEKSVCDKLVQDFVDLNNKVLKTMVRN